jgi:hypothetical protein
LDIVAACFHWSKNFLDLAVVVDEVDVDVEARDFLSADWPRFQGPLPPSLLVLSASCLEKIVF